MVDIVKETLDVEVKNPVVSPAPLSCNPYGLNRRLLWPIPIRIRMEILFQDRFQVSLDYHLCNAICHRWDSSRQQHIITVTIWDGQRLLIPFTVFEDSDFGFSRLAKSVPSTPSF